MMLYTLVIYGLINLTAKYLFLSQQTFNYSSTLWSNKETFNLDGGKTGFDSQETKLPSYWTTSFSKICLGMKIGQQPVKFIVINKQANSLYSLIADGHYNATSLGRDTWRSLIGSDASLQRKCNKEGFNALVVNGKLPKPGSVSLVTTETIAGPVTLELGLVLEEIPIKPTLVETKLMILQTMVINILRRWDIFWCSERKLI